VALVVLWLPIRMPDVRLPFTAEQFFELFTDYNQVLWPVIALLWFSSAVAAWWLFSRRGSHSRWIAALLVAHWLWSAIAYHAVFFTRINGAAWIFAALFLTQAVMLFHAGVVRHRLEFASSTGIRAWVAWLLIVYSLIYPAINVVDHGSVVSIPTFGVPCPTTIFTAGLLMHSKRPVWRLAVIPVIWSVIGGSAAFLLGVRADYALPLAGVALALWSFGGGQGGDV
jgi:hypothetical protein